jgi:hypothetical protein
VAVRITPWKLSRVYLALLPQKFGINPSGFYFLTQRSQPPTCWHDPKWGKVGYELKKWINPTLPKKLLHHTKAGIRPDPPGGNVDSPNFWHISDIGIRNIAKKCRFPLLEHRNAQKILQGLPMRSSRGSGIGGDESHFFSADGSFWDRWQKRGETKNA